MTTDLDISGIQAQVDCYLSCIDQLKKDIPLYLTKHNQISKDTMTFSKMLRSVGTLETNKHLQDTLFLCASKYDGLESHKKIYEKALKSINTLLDNSKSKIISPMNEIINDISTKRKKQNQMLLQYKQSKKPLVESDHIAIEEMSQLVSYTSQTFPLNCNFFEEYRQESIKRLLNIILQTEIRYHCSVVEELSQVLQKLDHRPVLSDKQ